jgi:hypothetical protein
MTARPVLVAYDLHIPPGTLNNEMHPKRLVKNGLVAADALDRVPAEDQSGFVLFPDTTVVIAAHESFTTEEIAKDLEQVINETLKVTGAYCKTVFVADIQNIFCIGQQAHEMKPTASKRFAR